MSDKLMFFNHLFDNGDYMQWSDEEPTKVLFSGSCDACVELTEAQAYNLIRGFTSPDSVFSTIAER